MAAATRLTVEIAELDKRLATTAPTYRDKRAMAGDLARLRWLLSAYPASVITSRASDDVG